MENNTVGIVGIGNMGRAAVEKYCTANWDVYVYDAFPASVEKVKDWNLTIANTPDELCSNSEYILMFLPGPKEVSSFVGAIKDKNLLKDKILIDLSTVDPETTRTLADKCIKLGASGYFDAPILGRPDRAGIWTLPVGCDMHELPAVKKVLDVISNRIMAVGKVGNGNTIKLLNNLMFGAINTATAEIFSAAKKIGIDPALLYEAISESGAATVSNLFKSIAPKMVDEDYSPIFKIALLHKDMSLGIKMAKNAGAVLLAMETNHKLNEIAMAKGLGNQDSSAVVQVSDMISNIK